MNQVPSWLAEYGEVRPDEPLARHTTMRLGGPAFAFLSVPSQEQAVALVERLEIEHIPWRVLGGGSNVIVRSPVIPEVVIHPTFQRFTILATGEIEAEAGCITALFARRVSEAGWAGWVWGVGLPGTIGGAIVGNAGCFGGETKDGLKDIRWWSSATKRVECIPASEAQFAYRESRFKHERGLVLSAVWQLQPEQDVEATRTRMAEILIERKAHQPLGMASAGCVFKNLTQQSLADIERVERITNKRVPSPARERGIIPTGWLLDVLGFKGYAHGTARISDRHGNFFLSDREAKADDLVELQTKIQEMVQERCGLYVQAEAVVW